MPARKDKSFYSVYVTSYASLEARDRILDVSSKSFHVGVEDFVSEDYYSGNKEHLALRAFHRACKEASHKPLAISIRFVKDFKTEVDVKPG